MLDLFDRDCRYDYYEEDDYGAECDEPIRNPITEVSCKLSDGTSSEEPSESEQGISFNLAESVNFQDNQVRAIKAYEGNENYPYCLYFYNDKGQELCNYNPARESPNSKQIVKLKENERLIGVYGARNHAFFKSLGFLYIDMNNLN